MLTPDSGSSSHHIRATWIYTYAYKHRVAAIHPSSTTTHSTTPSTIPPSAPRAVRALVPSSRMSAAKLLSSASASVTASATSPPTPTPPLPAPQPLSGSFGSSAGGSYPIGGFASQAHVAAAADNRRPSPWHEIAHSLSTTSLPPRSRRDSTPSLGSTPPFAPHTPESDVESQALRDWDRLLAAPDSDATRLALITATTHGSPHLAPLCGTPKLAAERDKEGHIEYKLKLIEPSPERFEKLVTQMMWRLKQGKNEAIYELGLADDGTVIGLTRAEMDASLRTLERMASEVGATVIVLKEIVLAPPSLLHAPDSPNLSSSSLSSAASGTPTWWSRRPDLDENGKPRKGTRSLGGVLPEIKTKKERLAAAKEKERALAEEQGDFDLLSTREREGSATASDDEPSPFQLDMDDSPPPSAAASAAALNASRGEAKRRKAAARREQRRLDLLRGDGTSAMPYTETRSSSAVAEFIGHAPNSSAVLAAARIPHQPARPSSLRLARTHSGSVKFVSAGPGAARNVHDPRVFADTPTPDEAFIDGLSLPLDSLSLSFADVTTMDGDDGGATASGSPEDHFLPASGEETICVEALVVRKNHGDWDAENGWEFGGEDDGWGFGGDD